MNLCYEGKVDDILPVIDRFEDEMAIFEGGNLPRERLPMATREGDVIKVNEHGIYYIDLPETKARRENFVTRLQFLLRKAK